MLPEPGSVAWKRESLHAETARLDQSAAYHREQAGLAEYPTTRDADLNCAARAAYCASVLRTIAKALWPPERGLTPADLGIVAAYLDGLELPLAPPLTRPEAREDRT